ncbi:MAG: sensor histidine kinase [Cellulosilyticaceae bacterium]
MEYKNRMGSGLQVRKIKKGGGFATLFSKLFTLYIAIIMVVMVFFFVLFSNTFKMYFVEYTQDIMLKQAQMIAAEYQAIGEYRQPLSRSIDRIFFKLEVLDSYLDATTWIVDKNNRMLVVSENQDSDVLARKLTNEKIVAEIFAGQIVSFQGVFDEYFDTSVLTVGYPIKIFDKVEYALFIHTPMPQIEKTIDEVRIIMFQAILMTTFLTFILIYFVSRRMTKPLKLMGKVAKQVANGDFDKRIDIEGEDEIAQLAVSLNYMASELDKIDANRKAFIANVSHDMRSPLTSIQGFVTAMLDGTIPVENQEKYLQIVLNESQRMIKMTNDILELNKLEEGNLPLKKMEFDIHEMIRDLLDNFEVQTREKEVTVSLILNQKVQKVFADPEKIARVVQNLLDNAFKFVNIQGTIEVETLVKQNKVWVYIKNSGPAIPKEEQHSIWERFYKADLSRGKDKKGMGIGLVIVREIMKQHGEILGITSNEGEMVMFYFSLDKYNS